MSTGNAPIAEKSQPVDIQQTTFRRLERTRTEYARQLNHSPFSGMIDDVRKQNVMKKLDGIKAPSECAHALAMLKIVLSWALRHHFIDRITCDGLRRSQAHNGMAHERGLGHEEFNAAILAAATEYPFGPIVQLLALTGQRRREIAALKWEWINQKGKTITLPSHVPKNGLFLRRPATLQKKTFSGGAPKAA